VRAFSSACTLSIPRSYDGTSCAHPAGWSRALGSEAVRPCRRPQGLCAVKGRPAPGVALLHRSVSRPGPAWAGVCFAERTTMSEDLDEIVAITPVPDGVRLDFRSGNALTLRGMTVEEAEHDVGCVGDRVPRREVTVIEQNPAEKPTAVAELKKPPT
jgi:hypothetical protein